MQECWNPKLDPIHFQAVKLHRCRERSYLVSGKKTSWADTGKKKQNKDCPALEHKLYSKQGKKKFQQSAWTVSATNVRKKHAVTAEIFTTRELRYFLHFCIKVTASAGIQRLGKHTISLSSSSFSSSKKRIALTLFTARSFHVSSDISFTKLSSAPHRGRLSVRTAKCD